MKDQNKRTDIFTKEKRSEVMSHVRSENTKPEMAVRSLLHRMGYRFRLHRKDLPGKPDIVLTKYRAVIFVHGCFWHQHRGCKRSTPPKQNAAFWKRKLSKNVERDNHVKTALKEAGWNVMIIWECELHKEMRLVKTKITRFLKEKCLANSMD